MDAPQDLPKGAPKNAPVCRPPMIALERGFLGTGLRLPNGEWCAGFEVL